jgi:cysteine desulfurase
LNDNKFSVVKTCTKNPTVLILLMTNELQIYLDNNATTPIDSHVLEEMLPYFKESYANASSTHRFGLKVNESVTLARNNIAALISAQPEEIIFTSGATEAINLVLKGTSNLLKPLSKHIVTVSTEHSATIDCCKYLTQQGYDITYLPVQSNGTIDLGIFKESLRPETILVSIMLVNNEIGTIQPIKEISKMAHEVGAIMFTDATQALGKIPIDVNEIDVDLMCFSGHKIYGPKGIGAFYRKIRGKAKFKITPLIHGGGHEWGLRSGTLNVPGIIGLGKACSICHSQMKEESQRIQTLRNNLETSLLKIENTFVNGHSLNRMHNITNICFKGADSEAIILGLKNIAVSNGSACTSTSIYPSHVLKALGLSDEDAFSSIRFSLGRFNTSEEIDIVVENVSSIIKRLRNMN